MTENQNLETIRRYYEGCNRPDTEQMMSCFTPDIVHYFRNSPPVREARELANLCAGYHEEGVKVHWTVDHVIAQGDEAVIEWSMVHTRAGRTPPAIIIRGAEWYFFKEGKISEIRAYELVKGDYQTELNGFPYTEKGYPTLPTARSETR